MRQNRAGPKDHQGEALLKEKSPRMGSRDEGLTRCWDETGHSPTVSRLLPTAHSSLRDVSSTESYTLPHAHHHIFAFTSGNNNKRNRKAMGGGHHQSESCTSTETGWPSIFLGLSRLSSHSPPPPQNELKPLEKRI